MLHQITLTNFRSYESVRYEFAEQISVIAGKNGIGKTNLLEAISLLSPGRGLRGAKLEEIRRFGENEWSVVAEVAGYKIATGLEVGKARRTIKIDDEKQSGSNALAQYVSCVWLTPQMDNIFLEGNSERRAFFDRLIFNFDPEHANRLAVYENAMRERMRLLKDNVQDKIWLNTLETRMAEYGIAIAAARNDLISYLQDAVNKAATNFPKPEFELRSKYENMLERNSALAVENELKKDLQNARSEDARNGRTNYGVHRADFHVVNTAKNVPASLCSTGEQKALLLSTILGLARLLREKRNRTPILLLDEVVSHLDESRRKELLDEITALGCQSFLTGTDESLFAGLTAFRLAAA